MTKKSKLDRPLYAAGLMGAIGFEVAACIGLGYWIGSIVSTHTGRKGWLVGGVLIGLLIGLVSAVFVVMKVLEDSDG